MLREILISSFGQVGLQWSSLLSTHFALLVVGFILAELRRAFNREKNEKDNKDLPPLIGWRIPYIGHTLSFIRNSEALLTYGRRLYGNTRKMFAIQVGRITFYILNDPRHVATFYRETEKLPFDHFLAKTITGFGISPEGVKKIFATSLSEGRKSIVWKAHDLQVDQTRGQNLATLDAAIHSFLQRVIHFDTDHKVGFARFGQRGHASWSLKTWTTETIIHALQDVYFGDELAKIEPDMPHILAEFDNVSHQAWYGYPSFLTPTRNRLDRHMKNCLKRFFELPQEQRRSTASFTQSLENECRAIGLENEDLLSLMLFMYWGISTNTSKTAFWFFSHIIFHPELADTIRNETAAAFRDDGSVDTEYLVSKCPIFHSIWLETLRFSAASTAVRYIMEDTKVGNTVLPKGNALMYSARQLHLENSAFGKDHNEFDPFRFYNRPALENISSFRPFGGGQTLCPGRHLAKHMLFTLVAITLKRYDLTLAYPQQFPRYKECKPSIGIISGHDDLIFEAKARIV